jgi:hypothetical protein
MVELTKYGAQTNYRVPPQSTGARIAHYEHWYFKVTGLSGEFKLPASYNLTAAGIFGSVHSLEAFEGGHRLLVTASNDSPLDGFIIDDVFTLTHAGGEETGQLKAYDAVYLASTGIVDAHQPDHHLAIDQLGAAAVRFTEGEPQFDSYGLMRMVEPTRIVDYNFRFSTLSDQFQQKITGTGSLTHIPSISSIALDVGTAAGDSITYTSNRFHKYTPGVSSLVTMSVSCGDSGKANCKRRWGYFANQNGVFFELDGVNLSCVLRSNTTGSIVEQRITQVNWSHDRADGRGGATNRSQLDLDVTKHNVYWIDFQWHGAGVVRFGTYAPSGKRIILHVFENANKNIGPYMLSASLPVKWEVCNAGVTASPSRMNVVACALFKEGKVAPDHENNNAKVRSWTHPSAITITNAPTFVAAFRAKSQVDGTNNRRFIVPKTLHYMSVDQPVMVRIYAGTVLTGTETWNPASMDSGAEVAIDGAIPVAEAIGLQVGMIFINKGATAQQVSQSFNSLGNVLHTLSDGTAGVIYSLWVQTLDPAHTTTFYSGLDWVEV